MSKGFTLRRELRAAQYRAAGHWRNELLQDYVRRHASRRPEHAALIDEGVTISYSQLDELSDRVAAALIELGIEGGDVVSVQLPNWWEFAILMLGIEKIGAVVNPLSTILRRRELHQMLHLAGSKLLVIPNEFGGFAFVEMAASLQAELPGLKHVLLLRGGRSERSQTWESVISTPVTENLRREMEARPADASAVCELAFTSGTTGEPKGVLHSHETALATVRSTIERQRLGERDVFHVATPVGHNAGYFYGLRVTLQAGGTAVLQDRWNAQQMIELVERHAVTFTMGPTTFLVDFLEAAEGKEQQLESLHVFTCGGAPIPPSIAAEFEGQFPGILCPVFGMTEMGHATSTGPGSSRAKALTTDGLPQPEMEVKVVAASGAELRPHDEGRLKFRGPFLFMGYLQGEEFTSRHFDSDGFFDSGDLGYLDDEGYIRVTGRFKDIIIRGGENVPVREIEDLLAEHPGVAGIAVIGIPDKRLGERAVACIQPRGEQPLTVEALRTFLAEREVARVFWPEAVECFEALPLTPSGKIQRAELRRILSQRISRVCG